MSPGEFSLLVQKKKILICSFKGVEQTAVPPDCYVYSRVAVRMPDGNHDLRLGKE